MYVATRRYVINIRYFRESQRVLAKNLKSSSALSEVTRGLVNEHGQTQRHLPSQRRLIRHAAHCVSYIYDLVFFNIDASVFTIYGLQGQPPYKCIRLLFI